MLIFCGDIHGDWQSFYKYIKKYDIKDSDIIINGDIGLGFDDWRKEEKVLLYFSKLFKNRNINVYALRGNHDEPGLFDNRKIGNIKLVEDYSILNIQNKNILFIGGAISVDRIDRKGYKHYKGRKRNKNYKGYWENEQIVYKDCKKLENINIVATHSAPPFVPPYTKGGITNYLNEDVYLKNDIIEERQTLNQVYNDLKLNNNIEYWFYGHFHFSSKVYEDNTTFVALNCNELYEL